MYKKALGYFVHNGRYLILCCFPASRLIHNRAGVVGFMDKTRITDLVIFRPQGTGVAVEVKLLDENVWLRQEQIAALFGTQLPAITKHLVKIFRNKELNRFSVCSILEHTAKDGKAYRCLKDYL
ncbi:MAG: hypothetical protein HQL20_09595 [Candidatus Omnitrophica bacterium]|nr:hypothetical protein [Candidatus Omnitrophota bacterium]